MCRSGASPGQVWGDAGRGTTAPMVRTADVGPDRTSGGRRLAWGVLTAPLVAAVLLTAGVAALAGEEPAPVQATATSAPAGDDGEPPDDPSAYWRTDGERPDAHPAGRSWVGAIGFGAELDTVVELLGPPDEQYLEPQTIVIGETLVSRWALDGAEVVVQALPHDHQPVEYIRLSLDGASPVRAALWGGVVAGESTLGEVAAAWGGDHDRRVLPAHPEQWAMAAETVEAYRHTLVWPACAADVPLLIGVGHEVPAPAGSRIGDPLPAFDPAVLDAPATDVWVAWADAEPVHHGCG